MKITISQPPPAEDINWEHAGVQSPASITVDLDDGTRIDFTGQLHSLLDLKPDWEHEAVPFSPGAMTRLVQPGGGFQVTLTQVKEVEFSRTPAEG